MARLPPREHHEEVTSGSLLRRPSMGLEAGLGQALQNLIVGRDITGWSAFTAGA
jgi:hypothetical protein